MEVRHVVPTGQVALEEEEPGRVLEEYLRPLPLLRLVVGEVVEVRRRHGLGGETAGPALVLAAVLLVRVPHELALLVQEALPPLLPHHRAEPRPLLLGLGLGESFLSPVTLLVVRLQVRQLLEPLEHDLPWRLVRRPAVEGVALVPPEVVVAEGRVRTGRRADQAARAGPQGLRRRGAGQRGLHLVRRGEPQVALGLELVDDPLPGRSVQGLLRVALPLRGLQLGLPLGEPDPPLLDLDLRVLRGPHRLDPLPFERRSLQLLGLLRFGFLLPLALLHELGEVLLPQRRDGPVVHGPASVVCVGED